MAHQSLYRRYRSRNFEEIRGQSHVTNALRAAVRDGRQSHAYLFSGPRGTGKTSTARVLAKALNCENLQEGEPCTECESCLAIEQGTSFDLHELDAASNNKVDDIRDLIAKVALGSPGRTKVYILDEVHMLSSGAENALLKTLEEPPAHVVFVLATTEPHKVVETIRSRTQPFEFRLLPSDDLDSHLRWVIQDAGLDVDDDGIEYALRRGGGSARDTLSALDLVAATGGVPSESDVGTDLAKAIGAGDAAAGIAAIQRALESGREPRVIGETTLDTLRSAFLASMGAPLDQLSERAQDTATSLGAELGPATITRSLETIGQALVEMRQAPDPRVPLEVAVLTLARRDGADTAALMQRIEALEARLAAFEAGGGPAPQAAAPAVAPAPAPAPAPEQPAAAAVTEQPQQAAPPATAPAPRPQRRSAPPRPAPSTPTAAPVEQAPPQQAPSQPAPEPAAAQGPPQAAPPQAAPAPTGGAPLVLATLQGDFDELLASVSQKVRSKFRLGGVTAVNGSTVVFGFPNQFGMERCNEVKSDMEAAISQRYGQAVTIELQLDGSPPPPAPSTPPEAPAPTAPVDTEAEAAEVGDVSELADASDAATSGIDRLTEAFPGAEIVEPRE